VKPLSPREALDRHVLVLVIWLSLGFVAVALFDFGLGAGGTAYILAGYAAIVVAFVGHVIVNAIYGTTFTRRELALGLILYAAALVAFGLAVLLSPGFGLPSFLAMSLGLLAVGAAVIFYMVTHFGVRRVFTAFDVVRDFRPESRSSDERTQP
jgi:hypothetical protein